MKATHSKSFNRIGKWTERRTKSEILTCSCGNKYIKTRKDQDVCVKCLVKVEI